MRKEWKERREEEVNEVKMASRQRAKGKEHMFSGKKKNKLDKE